MTSCTRPRATQNAWALGTLVRLTGNNLINCLLQRERDPGTLLCQLLLKFLGLGSLVLVALELGKNYPKMIQGIGCA
eukprot:4180335-Prorocentrum_lima.AAC.1